MPLDQYDDEDAKPTDAKGARGKAFDCPDCSANNPYDDGFYAGDEIRCFYCGLEYKVEVRDDGRFKFRAI